MPPTIEIDQTDTEERRRPDETRCKKTSDEVVSRYAALYRLRGWVLLRFKLKCLLWRTVIQSTYGFKRGLDVLVSGTMLVMLMPFFALTALLIRLDSPGAVLFRQARIGKWGRTFFMYKFRSMYIDAEERKRALMEENEMAGGVTFKMKRDPRITRVGRFIRKASIDELPQLWNVFKGEMSLVGPRPPVPKEVAEYTLEDRQRLEVIPGITCIWQISGRSDIPFDQQVQLDVQYIQSQSFLGDIAILCKTIPAVLFGRGAY